MYIANCRSSFSIFVIGLPLGGCSSCAELKEDQNDTISNKVIGKKNNSSSVDWDRYDAALYRRLAPPSWSPRNPESSEQNAARGLMGFIVDTGMGSERSGRVISGGITLNGSYESIASHWGFSPEVMANGQKKYADVAQRYPDVDGFDKAVVSEPIGYNIKTGIDRRLLSYVNHKHGIYCRSYNPGRTRCVWGDETVRYMLNFNSLDTVEALNYLSKLP
ncbi:hypothetical protein [Sphingorhabdus sp. M41]|uniref:hypothetical protein n=1 Tax=Sphingorhabdus sp. M41 TaxID=1806885 RepID=UPI0012E7C1E6|nr:hypothetical protein [Sphingorhabdus sp. M41]